MIKELKLKREEMCDKCNKILPKSSVVYFHSIKKLYKHKECPPNWTPQKNTRPTGIDLMVIIETFRPMTEFIGKKGIDMLKYEEDELVKLFWIYKQYLRDKDKEVPF